MLYQAICGPQVEFKAQHRIVEGICRILGAVAVFTKWFHIGVGISFPESTMQVAKWGNPPAVRLPADLVCESGLQEGDQINLVRNEGELKVQRQPRAEGVGRAVAVPGEIARAAPKAGKGTGRGLASGCLTRPETHPRAGRGPDGIRRLSTRGYHRPEAVRNGFRHPRRKTTWQSPGLTSGRRC